MSSTAISDAVIPYPFSDSRTFALCIGSLELRDIGRAARVCKDWNRAIKSNELWQSLFKREGIPLVKSLSGSPRDLRADFKVLYPITISARAISRFFGNIVGQVPDISEKWLMKLNDPDPFERSKTIGENFVLILPKGRETFRKTESLFERLKEGLRPQRCKHHLFVYELSRILNVF